MTNENQHTLSQWLILQAQSGQAQALEQLLRIWRPKIVAYARHTGADHANAQDIAQEVMLSVSRNLLHLEEPAAFSTWIFRIVHNKSIDWVRKEARHSNRTTNRLLATDHEDIRDITDTDAPPANQILKGLDRESYQLLYLHYIEDFSLAQISQITNIKKGTLKSRLHGIKKRIQHQQGDTNENS